MSPASHPPGRRRPDRCPSARPRPGPSPLAAALAVAASQYGTLSCAQALGCGLATNDLRRLVRRREWLHSHRQVYVVRSLVPPAGGPERLLCVVMAAELALGPRACAAGPTAARLWGMRGLERWDGRGVHMAVPGLKARRHLAGVDVHGWNVLPEEVTVPGGGSGGWCRGVRVTDPGRTLRDTLPGLDRERAVCLMDSALNQGLLRERGIGAVNDAMRGRTGCVDVRRWWGLADGRAQSPLETRIRLICQDAGLPPDELQRRFTDRNGGTVAVVDFWWEGARLIGEADGIGPHSTPRALARDRERQNALQRLYPGVRIARFTWSDLRRPGYILALVAGEGRALG
ncbi:endonuclease domain-containing protein [Nocardiopsis exhalans]|uniref:Endonuclease domain-containing protein n=1 Tax=Nocardiopsis exhalans TaxID=163604 RepID=A0ABY5DGJ8_9ACTN|nr:endonuclease domain-containing protein [Nocardiopsis exhalans]USY22480.1 endonuclease domain-containing protein [Nocardiopsis exhalans]